MYNIKIYKYNHGFFQFSAKVSVAFTLLVNVSFIHARPLSRRLMEWPSMAALR